MLYEMGKNCYASAKMHIVKAIFLDRKYILFYRRQTAEPSKLLWTYKFEHKYYYPA